MADFNNLEFMLLGLQQPQSTFLSGNDAYCYLYYGLSTAQVLDARVSPADNSR